MPYLLIQSIAMTVAGAVGLWLFYVQHQFEGVYWERGDNWDYTAAALRGSSYYKLPKVLQWLSGNIGFHHIHHLSPRIPNYNLQRCHESDRLFQQVTPITLRSSLQIPADFVSGTSKANGWSDMDSYGESRRRAATACPLPPEIPNA